MPSSVVRTFTDADEYFAEIQNLREGLVLRRGEFRAGSTVIQLPRAWMCRFDENLPRIMRITPSGKRAWISFATTPAQPAIQINGIEITHDQISRNGLHWESYLQSSAASKWGTMSLAAAELAAAGQAIIGRELLPTTFPRTVTPPSAALSRFRKVHDAVGISPVPPRTSSRSPRLREQWTRLWSRR